MVNRANFMAMGGRFHRHCLAMAEEIDKTDWPEDAEIRIDVNTYMEKNWGCIESLCDAINTILKCMDSDYRVDKVKTLSRLPLERMHPFYIRRIGLEELCGL